MKKLAGLFCTLWGWFNCTLDFLAPVGVLLARVLVANEFFKSGLTKIQSFDTTITLFTYEYSVPILSPYWAAVMGTFTEITMPILIVLGLFGRFPSFVLFIFNIIAVISYPFLWTEAGAVGFNDHFWWGVVLMLLMLRGTDKLSLDNLFCWLWHKRKASS